MKIVIIRNVVLVLFACVSFAVNAQDEARAEECYAVGVSEFRAGRIEKSLAAFRRCDSLRTKTDDYIGVTTNTKHWIAYILFQQGRVSEARRLDYRYCQLEPVDSRRFSESMILERESSKYLDRGEYESAYRLMGECMKMEKRIVGENHYFVANTYRNLGDMACMIESRHRDAFDLYGEALRIYESYGVKGEAISQEIRINMSYAASINGKLDLAESYLPDYDDLWAENRCVWYCNKMIIQNARGDTAGVINTGRSYMKSDESKEDSVYFESVAITLRDALLMRGCSDEAIDVSDRFCRFVRKKYGCSSLEYMIVVTQTVNIYMAAGRNMDAVGFFRAALQGVDLVYLFNDDFLSCKEDEIPKYSVITDFFAIISNMCLFTVSLGYQGNFEENFGGLVSKLNDLGWRSYYDKPCYTILYKLYLIFQQYIADSYFRKGESVKGYEVLEDIMAQRCKERDWNYYYIKSQCAINYYEQHDYKKAAAYLDDCVNHYINPSGMVELALAASLWHINPKSPRIADLCKISVERIRKRIVETALSTSESNRGYNWDVIKPNNDMFAVLANLTGCKNGEINTMAFNSILMGKSFYISSQADIHYSIYQSGDSAIIDGYERIRNRKNELGQRIDSFRKAGMDSIPNYDFNEFVEVVNEETQLMSKLMENNDFVSKYVVTFDDVRRSLPERSVAVEFVYSVDDINSKKGSYYAYVVRRDWESPVVIKLSLDENKLNQADVYQNKRLSAQVWQEIVKRAKVREGDTICFATDKVLHNVSIENMMWGKGDEPIGAFYYMRRVTSTRQLTMQRSERQPASVVLYGGLDYAGDGDSTHNGADTLNRGSVSGLSPLPGTKQEVDEIVKVFEESPLTCKITCYTGNDGTEESFARLSGSAPSVLHIATHGDYAESQDSAMFKSVLYFAGSEEAYFRGDGALRENDGIVTADEIMNMDLSDVDLAVLSACSSAVGGISPDGVVGLQRGFKNAGVKSLIMTLWPVNDSAAKVLMVEFYGNWIEKGMSKHDALEAAKKTVRETKGWSDPEYWAGFILLD